jgi:tight adherence protein B
VLLLIVAVLGFVTIAGLGFALTPGGGTNPKTLKRAQTITASGGKAERLRRAKAAANDPTNRRKQLVRGLKAQEREQRRAANSLESRMVQAGLEFPIIWFWAASAGFAVAAFLTTLVFHQPIWAAAGLAVAAGLGLPRWIVGFLAKRRTKAFTEAFSDAIDIIVRGIKSGLPVHDCLRIIARESPAPLGPEFQKLVENIAMGVALDQGLEKMYQRMPTSELRFFSIVLSIQAKTGGNLAEALGNLSSVLRARKLMREKIKAMSSEATASAFIIGCLPPGVVTLITVASPAYMTIMFTDPRGNLMLMAGAMWMGLGIFVMRRMINFKY